MTEIIHDDINGEAEKDVNLIPVWNQINVFRIVCMNI